MMEKEQVENAHKEEYDSFNGQWNQKMEEKQNLHLTSIQQLQEKHQQDLQVLNEQLEQSVPMVGKYSSETLN
jgi:hypothetical protein